MRETEEAHGLDWQDFTAARLGPGTRSGAAVRRAAVRAAREEEAERQRRADLARDQVTAQEAARRAASQRHRSVPCPRCGVPPGARCLSPGGSPADTHRARRDLADAGEAPVPGASHGPE